uniref:Uncharacterized protein n=1 Tax=Rhodococcoides fascians D188 TaxID=1051973 RepID=G8JZ02_RHOFA|nr:hypothetical protein pFi_137 [Rhodococcus fascians D188]
MKLAPSPAQLRSASAVAVTSLVRLTYRVPKRFPGGYASQWPTRMERSLEPNATISPHLEAPATPVLQLSCPDRLTPAPSYRHRSEL